MYVFGLSCRAVEAQHVGCMTYGNQTWFWMLQRLFYASRSFKLTQEIGLEYGVVATVGYIGQAEFESVYCQYDCRYCAVVNNSVVSWGVVQILFVKSS